MSSLRDIRFLLKPTYSNSHALVIGIDDYEHSSPLAYAVSDASVLAETLNNALDFPKDNIVCLVNKDATRDRILRAFHAFSGGSVALDDRIIIFFAGHGHTRTGIRGEIGYLVPYDGNVNDPSSLIRWDEFTRNSELIAAKHMLFIMDACYGGLALTRAPQAGSSRFVKDMMLRYSRQVLTAGKADQIVADSGGPLPNHSVFTGHLLQGLGGSAVTEQGIITASGLMAYVHNKVANDKNSNQTPHYGYFDGDGDFILKLPAPPSDDPQHEIDELVAIPFFVDESPARAENKVSRVKKLLDDESGAIALNDFMVEEVKLFLSRTSEDNFKVQGSFTKEEFQQRLTKYEEASSDLCALLATIAYWAKPRHKLILQKMLARSTDRLDVKGGLTAWLSLRWYPMILELYSCGIAAVEGGRYDSLFDVFFTKLGTTSSTDASPYFVQGVVSAQLEMLQMDLFKALPVHERHHTPISEYLFKLLQPKLDDILFVGANYESAFDEFEVILSLVTAELRVTSGQRIWGPVGRFGWKKDRTNNPFSKLLVEAKASGANWAPLKAGFFGGDSNRFSELATNYAQNHLAKVNWW